MNENTNQEKIMSILEYRGVTIIERKSLIELIQKHLAVKDINDLIENLLRKRRLIIIQKGIYAIVPFSSIDQTPLIDEYQVISFLLKDIFYYGLHNAAIYHNLIDQIPNSLVVFNKKYSGSKNVLGKRILFHKISPKKMFGILQNKYSDKERTIIDMVDKYDYFGGLSAVIEMITGKYNEPKLLLYAKKFGSIKVMKLIGWITHNEDLFQYLEKKNAFTYYTTLAKTGLEVSDTKWKLRLT